VGPRRRRETLLYHSFIGQDHWPRQDEEEN
jgi:hypothetical protein